MKLPAVAKGKLAALALEQGLRSVADVLLAVRALIAF